MRDCQIRILHTNMRGIRFYKRYNEYTWKAVPSRIGLILDVTPKALEKVIYFSAYIVTDKGFTALEDKQLLTENEYNDMVERYGEDAFKASDKLERETAAPVPEQIRDLKKKEVRFTKVIDRENIADAVFDFVNNK